MFDKFFQSHEIVCMFVAVVLNAIFSMMLSEKPFRGAAAVVSWAFTMFLGLMLIVLVVMYLDDIFGSCLRFLGV